MRPRYSFGQSTLAPVPKGVTFFWMKPSISSVKTSVSLDMTSLRAIFIENIYQYIFSIKT